MNAFPTAPIVVDAARAAAGNLRSTLGRHANRLWALLATVPATVSGPLPRTFLKDSAEVAFHSPIAVAECMMVIQGSLTGHGVLEMAGSDPAALTGLCVLAANAGVGPGMGEDGGLSNSLMMLQPDARMSVARSLTEWPSSVAQSARACWLAFLQGQSQPAFLPDEVQASAVSLSPTHHEALGMGGLRKVLSLAPPELCCSFDRQLLTDPVRSPYGHVFEYTVLAWVLSQNGGSCPITNQPLTLESCQRDEDLKVKATSWSWTTWLGW